VKKLDIFRKTVKQIRTVIFIEKIINVLSIKAIAINSKTIEDNIEAKEIIEEVMKPVKRATYVMEAVSQSK